MRTSAYSNAIDLDPDRGAPIFSERHEFSPVTHRIRCVVGLGIEIGEVKETHPSQRPNVGIVIWPLSGSPPFGVGNRWVRQNLPIASDTFEALRRGRMPKPAMQGSQTIFSEVHGIQFQTPVAAKGTRPIRARIRRPGDEGRGRADVPVSHTGLSLNRAYRQPSNQNKFTTSHLCPKPMCESPNSLPRDLLFPFTWLPGWRSHDPVGGTSMPPEALRGSRDNTINGDARP